MRNGHFDDDCSSLNFIMLLSYQKLMLCRANSEDFEIAFMAMLIHGTSTTTCYCDWYAVRFMHHGGLAVW